TFLYVFFFFFFQAEDGIRDGHVTGVQTCALPIFASCRVWSSDRSSKPDKTRSEIDAGLIRSMNLYNSDYRVNLREAIRGAIEARSEERRVGKECRCGWGREL